MAFHWSNFGRFGESLRYYANQEGYVPEAGDPKTEWPERTDEEWEEHVAAAVRETEEAQAALHEWQRKNV